jgi:hypothetical protein
VCDAFFSLAYICLMGIALTFLSSQLGKSDNLDVQKQSTNQALNLPIKILKDSDNEYYRSIEILLPKDFINQQNIERIFSLYHQILPRDNKIFVKVFSDESSLSKKVIRDCSTCPIYTESVYRLIAHFIEEFNGKRKISYVFYPSGIPSKLYEKDYYELPSNIKFAGKLISKTDLPNSHYSIIVQEFPIEDAIDNISYYSISSQPKFLNTKNVIFTLLLDQRLDTLKSPVTFIKDNVICVYSGWRYAVSFDKGFSWDTWNARDVRPLSVFSDLLIRAVDIKPTGTGTMKLYDNVSDSTLILYTNNYGKTWKEK